MRLLKILCAAILVDSWTPQQPFGSKRFRRFTKRNLIADGKDSTVEDVVTESLRRLLPVAQEESCDWKMIRSVLRQIVYTPHAEDWSVTRESAVKLAAVLPPVDSPEFRCMFGRVLEDGGYDNAEKQFKPWVVLVAGLNGIRKTTSLYATWFQDALAEALQLEKTISDLPWGGNSFFRQLDYIIATIANIEFEALYKRNADIDTYAKMKAAIFSKYRTAAELIGLVLLEAKRGANVLVETSGRDAGLFGFVDLLFDDDEYKKLVIYFDVDEIEYAKRSVANRMQKEIKLGSNAVAIFSDLLPLENFGRESSPLYARAIVDANCGGPYGPDVLDSVQADSRRVWFDDVIYGNVAASWNKAVIRIHADADDTMWTAQALPPPEGLLLNGESSSSSARIYEFDSVPPH
mmetsp:Transcript_19070/g.28838  ORF Transcript_19070/g.28838 Transcript_19070/m.28838 type:complete len:405 (-) Transcript_19070:1217-2431(-)|eukprot:CAMPEP_0197320386 /NCGR_PEP_ID=MMETSP0891-20130614/59552_1 /TAXON_ID=44058 ORGANISM="Aureoumbra lagunensis, Strain CCMP1510" /NCGR_SAMPLE_ID=MMETSP0891 /ASSEMBLY_ACC=CAM_ASM_000534 /LENGTH=404 /DNA_ID=CAMNT_0042811753 /DNA_START=12 /DNA_END=1226 /DNA_ORIENTATION=-